MELVALAPDVILAYGASTVAPLLQATRAVPIVFPIVGDPVGAGFVESLARPGGNVTGFMTNEYSIGGKWLELLKQIAPGVTRAAILRDSTQGSGTSMFAAVQAVAPSLRVEVSPVNMRDAGETERAIAAFALSPNGGLVVTAGGAAARHRDLIVTLASRHKLPAVYFERSFAAAGGLVSYGADYFDQFRLAAGYVDRILKGEKPADQPVQAPTKYELVLNLKTARVLGLDVPAALLARADEVIEKRREFILYGGAAMALPAVAKAQSGKLLTLGFLGTGTPQTQGTWLAALVQRLRELNWIDGHTIAIDVRWAEGRPERYAEITSDFVKRKVDVIVTSGSAVPTLMQATSVIPIVFGIEGDPVGRGLVASLARPGGNVTGLSSLSAELAGKRLELLRELLPQLRRVAVMHNANHSGAAQEAKEAEAAAHKFGLEVVPAPIRRAEDIAPAFDKVEALYVCGDALIISQHRRINAFALGAHLPTMSASGGQVETGTLLTYGPNFPDMHRRAGDYVDKILRGGKPADMPVEQPTKFDLVINLTTARGLGLKIPETFLMRANEVIE